MDVPKKLTLVDMGYVHLNQRGASYTRKDVGKGVKTMKGIYKDEAKGMWCADVRKKGYPRTRRYFRTKSMAEGWKVATLAAMAAGTYKTEAELATPNPEDIIIFSDIADEYLKKVAIHGNSYGAEVSNISQFKDQPFASKDIHAVTMHDIESYRDKLLLKGNMPSSIKRMFTNMRAIFTYKKVTYPAIGLKFPEHDDARDRIFVGDEEERFLESAKRYGRGVLAPLCEFAIETTMRRGELIGVDKQCKEADLHKYISKGCKVVGTGKASKKGGLVTYREHEGLLWGMVDDKLLNLPASITKTGKARAVPLSPRAIEIIQSMKPKGKIDPASKVFDISPQGVKNAFPRACKDAGIVDFRFHDLRHVGTTKWSKKLSQLQLMRVTGHKDPRMLARYFNQEVSEIADMMGK